MKIKDISFEVFPPKTDAGFDKVLSATDQIGIETILYECNLWSRWRNQQEYTVKIASHIKDDLGVTSLAHLTCASSTKEEVARGN